MCRYLRKETPNEFPCLDIEIQTLGMWLDVRMAISAVLAARVSYAFLKVCNILSLCVTVSKHRGPFGIF